MTTTFAAPHQTILSFSTYLSTESAIEQLAPLVVVIVLPLLVLYGRNYTREFALHMLAVASSVLPWNWSSIHEHEHGSVLSHPKTKTPIRTRAEQLAARGDSRSGA